MKNRTVPPATPFYGKIKPAKPLVYIEYQDHALLCDEKVPFASALAILKSWVQKTKRNAR